MFINQNTLKASLLLDHFYDAVRNAMHPIIISLGEDFKMQSNPVKKVVFSHILYGADNLV